MAEQIKNPRERKIRITEHYYYTIDNLGNHTLYWIGNKEIMELGNGGKGTGQFRDVAETIGYYSSLENLVKAAISDSAYRKIESGEIETIQQHLTELTRITDKFKKTIGGF